MQGTGGTRRAFQRGIAYAQNSRALPTSSAGDSLAVA